MNPRSIAVRALLVGGLILLAGSAFALDTDRALTNFINVLNANMPPRNNPQAVAALYAEDGVQMHPFGEPPGGPFRGRDAMTQFFAGFEKRRADWTHVERSRIIQGNRAVWEGVAQGTDKATGKPVKLPIVFFWNSTGTV